MFKLFKSSKVKEDISTGVGGVTVKATKANKYFTGDTPSITEYQDAYKTADTVYSCVSFMADIASQVTFDVYKRKADGKTESIKDKGLSQWLNNPNPFFSFPELIKLYIQSYSLTGNAYLTFERVGGKFESWVLNPAMLKVVPHQTKYIEGYIYGEQVAYKREEIISLQNLTTDNQYYGQSPLATLVDPLEIEGFAMADIKDYYKNSMIGQGLLTSEYPLTKKQIADVREQFRSLYTLNKGSRHGYVILPNNLQFTSLKTNPRDGLLLESLNITSDRVYTIFRLSPKLLGSDSGHSTNGTELRELKANYINNTIRPLLNIFVKRLEVHLRTVFKDEELVVEANYTNIPEVNTAFSENIEAVDKAVSVGLISRNQGLKILGQPIAQDSKLMDAIFPPAYLLGTQSTDLVTGESIIFGEEKANE